VFPYEHQGLRTTFVICNETIEWVSRNDTEKFPVLDLVLESNDEVGGWGMWVPDGCVPVRLVPQCAPLPDLEPGSPATHEFAQEVRCYDDVSAIEWSKYSWAQ
jgi:hypothetical protein